MSRFYVNEIRLLGNLGANPEIRRVPNGSLCASFSLATTTSYKDAQGQWQDKTQWHRVVAWQNEKGPKLVDTIEKNCQKGDKVYVAGMVEYRSWQDKEGNTRYITEIKAANVIPLGGRAGGPNGPRMPSPAREASFDDLPPGLDDDDTPF